MTAEQILDFSTDGQFWTTDDGVTLRQFACDVYAVMGQGDDISFFKAAGVLFFSNEGSGAGSFTRWHQSGLLIIDQLNPPRINRRELVVAQLVKARIAATRSQTIAAVHSAVRGDLTGSGLEQHVAPNPDPKFENKIATVSLEFPDEPWLYELAPLTRPRTLDRNH